MQGGRNTKESFTNENGEKGYFEVTVTFPLLPSRQELTKYLVS